VETRYARLVFFFYFIKISLSRASAEEVERAGVIEFYSICFSFLCEVLSSVGTWNGSDDQVWGGLILWLGYRRSLRRWCQTWNQLK